MKSLEDITRKKDGLKRVLMAALEAKDIISAGAILSSIGALAWALNDGPGDIHDAMVEEFGGDVALLNTLFDKKNNAIALASIEKKDEPFIPA